MCIVFGCLGQLGQFSTRTARTAHLSGTMPTKSQKGVRALQLLHRVGYPVPRVDRLEQGSTAIGRPFFLMEYIDGQPMWSTMFKGSEERQARLLACSVACLQGCMRSIGVLRSKTRSV